MKGGFPSDRGERAHAGSVRLPPPVPKSSSGPRFRGGWIYSEVQRRPPVDQRAGVGVLRLKARPCRLPLLLTELVRSPLLLLLASPLLLAPGFVHAGLEFGATVRVGQPRSEDGRERMDTRGGRTGSTKPLRDWRGLRGRSGADGRSRTGMRYRPHQAKPGTVAPTRPIGRQLARRARDLRAEQRNG